MLYLSILSLAEQTAPEGGLFDFNATLPLMALQFLLLMVVLVRFSLIRNYSFTAYY